MPPEHDELAVRVDDFARRAKIMAERGDAAEQYADTLFSTVHDGVRGLAFIDAAVRSSAAGGVWTSVETRHGRS